MILAKVTGTAIGQEVTFGFCIQTSEPSRPLTQPGNVQITINLRSGAVAKPIAPPQYQLIFRFPTRVSL